MMKACTAVARIVAPVLLVAIGGPVVAQQAYPSKPIRIITPYPPGGSANLLARLVGQKLTDSWGQQVIVDNRPGGGTIIGTDAVAKAAPDGYTILLTTKTHVTIHLLHRNVPFDVINDFAPVATLGSTEFVLAVHPSVPANNLKELITLAKSKPGQLNYASSGSGSAGHLANELFNIMVGVKMQHIPYKGAGPAVADLVGGQVQLSFHPPVAVIQYIKYGKLKAIAISGATRLSALPQVPTFIEAGLPGFDVKTWQGVLAPATTPTVIIDKLSTEIAKILAMPDIMEKLGSQGMESFISTPEKFAAIMKADIATYAKVIKTANIKVEE